VGVVLGVWGGGGGGFCGLGECVGFLGFVFGRSGLGLGGVGVVVGVHHSMADR